MNRTLAASALAALASLALVAAVPADTQGLRGRLLERMREKSAATPPIDAATLVPGATRIDASYGSDPAQTLAAYVPAHAQNAPVIVMVHGGGWRIGDKNMAGVIENKVKHWLPKGFIFVSIDYRMLPDAQVDVQAQDVAAAVAYVESHAGEWGGDGNKLVLMGHSAGAHLVALMSADPARVTSAGGHPWAGTVVIDSAGYDIASVMSRHHMKLYDDAFGTDPAYWASLSPAVQLKPGAVPMFLICALKRPDDSCGQSDGFAAKIMAMGMDAPVSRQDMTHEDVNKNLGLPGAYTDAVDAFIAARLKP